MPTYTFPCGPFLALVCAGSLALGCGGGGTTATPQPSAGAASTLSFVLPGNTPLELVRIPAGRFHMGSPETEQDRETDESPQHQVTLSQAFHMGRFEVTQAQWVALMGSNPSVHAGDLNLPVENVTYLAITQTDGFLERLNAATAATRPAGKVFRLPTGSEWEYASRAGTTTRFSWGDDPDYSLLKNYAWYKDNNPTSDTHPVGQKLPNPWGLYDMQGNVNEFCQEWHGSYAPDSQTDPTGPATGTFRVMRGFSAFGLARYYRSAKRDYYYLDRGAHWIGLRVVLASPLAP